MTGDDGSPLGGFDSHSLETAPEAETVRPSASDLDAGEVTGREEPARLRVNSLDQPDNRRSPRETAEDALRQQRLQLTSEAVRVNEGRLTLSPRSQPKTTLMPCGHRLRS
jgi:hypothetical protein